MANYDLLTELLDLPQVRVTHYQVVGQQRLNLFVESTVPAAVCPECQGLSDRVHQVGERQCLRDLALWSRRCWLHYAPRRFKCPGCGTPFVERVPWRDLGLDYTTRYAQFVYERTRREAVAQVAQTEGLTEASVQGIFERGAKKRLPSAATQR
jgi:transposase